jgi:RimJ/RimL family protein N-acetyltransferase
MFPEIVRDDVFRVETRRLWLRWPDLADAAAVTAIAGCEAVAILTAHVPHPYPKGEASRRIDKWRSQNADGCGLTLVMTGRADNRLPFGIVGLSPVPGGVKLGVLLAPDHWGRGFATEAVQAMVDVAFALTEVDRVEASVRVINPGARRVFERCGFAYEGTLLGAAPARGGMLPFDGFRLDRKAWASLKGWRMAGLFRPPLAPPADAAGAATDAPLCRDA